MIDDEKCHERKTCLSFSVERMKHEESELMGNTGVHLRNSSTNNAALIVLKDQCAGFRGSIGRNEI